MPTTKVRAKKGTQYRTVKQRAVPMEELFEPWEIINWSTINADVAAGKAVHIESARYGDLKHWVGCALRELGRQNVYVAFCYAPSASGPLHGLWIIPRTMLSDVLLEEYERVDD